MRHILTEESIKLSSSPRNAQFSGIATNYPYSRKGNPKIRRDFCLGFNHVLVPSSIFKSWIWKNDKKS